LHLFLFLFFRFSVARAVALGAVQSLW